MLNLLASNPGCSNRSRDISNRCSRPKCWRTAWRRHISPPIRSLDMRYRGVEATLNVTVPADGDFVAATKNSTNSSTVTAAGPAIEIAAARVEVVGTLPAPEELVSSRSCVCRPSFDDDRSVILRASRIQRVFLREDLQPGDDTGPAIVCEPTSTVVVDPGSFRVLRGASCSD